MEPERAVATVAAVSAGDTPGACKGGAVFLRGWELERYHESPVSSSSRESSVMSLSVVNKSFCRPSGVLLSRPRAQRRCSLSEPTA